MVYEYTWWIAALAFFILELLTPATIFIFPAIAAVITGIVALFVPYLFVQAGVFFVLSIMFIVMIRPVLSKNETKARFGKDALIGSQVRVVETIDNNKDLGRVKSASDIFPARSIDGKIIPEHTLVEVVKIEGIKFFVKKSKS